MKKGNRLLSFALSMMLAVSLLPAAAMADEAEEAVRTEMTGETETAGGEPSAEETVSVLETEEASVSEQVSADQIVMAEEESEDPEEEKSQEETAEETPEETLKATEESLLENAAEEELITESGDASDSILQAGGLFRPAEKKAAKSRASKAGRSSLSALTGRLYEAALDWDGSTEKMEVNVSDLSCPRELVETGVISLINNHPDLFYLVPSYSYKYYTDSQTLSFVSLFFDTSYTRSDITDFRNACSGILSGVVSSWSDEQKALYLHDYLVTHCAYDMTQQKFTAYHTIVEGSSVCQGYALSYKYLLNEAGVDCELITSHANNHAWNLVSVGSGNYYVDCTWDDPTGMYRDYCEHTNFLRSRSGIAGTGHKSDDWLDSSGNNVYTNDPASDSYEGAWWSGCKCAVPHVGNQWAYVLSASSDSYNVLIHDYSAGSDAVLFTMNEVWHAWKSGGYYPGGYAHVAACGPNFYVTAADKIYRFTAEDSVPEMIYTLNEDEQEEGYIYGIQMQGNTLYYRLYTSPRGTDFAAEHTLTVDAADSDVKAAVIRWATASFQGRILLNFYLQLSDALLADGDAYVSFTGEKSSVQIPLSDAVLKTEDGENFHVFSYPVWAYEIRDNVNLKVCDGDGQTVMLTNLDGSNDYTESGIDYSLMTYCTKTLASAKTSDTMKALAKAAIDYGTAAQIYFGYKADGLEVSDDVPAVTTAQLAPFKGIFEGSLPQGVTGRSLTALFRSDNSLRIYFTYAADADPASYTYTVDGKAAELNEKTSGSGMEYYLEVSNVSADALGDLHSLAVADGSDTYTIHVSVMTYARACAVNGAEARKNLGKALYLYNEAAISQFRQEGR